MAYGCFSKRQYDAKVQLREFAPGQQILLLLLPTSESSCVNWQGPYIVQKRIEMDYEIEIPNKGLKLFHVNLLKAWNCWEEHPSTGQNLSGRPWEGSRDGR